jgi:hypothetical protein
VTDCMDGLLYHGMKRLTAGVNGVNGAYGFWFRYTAIMAQPWLRRMSATYDCGVKTVLYMARSHF